MLCPFTGIGGCMEIYGIYGNSSFGNHISSNRTVNPSGKQKHCFTACSYRHSSRALNDLGINIGACSHFNHNTNQGIMNIHLKLRKAVQKITSHVHTHLRCCKWVVLICSFSLHLEGKIPVRVSFFHIVTHSCFQLFPINGIHYHDRAYPCYSKDSFKGLYRFLIVIIIRAFYIDSPLLLGYQKVAELFQGIFNLVP